MGSATITINTDALSNDFLEGLKRMYPHKTVEISVQLADATDEILSNEFFAQELRERIAEYEAKKETILVKPNELLP